MSGATSGLKAALRQSLREEMARHSMAERAEASRRLCERLRLQPVWQQARAVLFFAPLPDEPDILSLVSEAISAGKHAVLPRYSPVSQQYETCRVLDLACDLQPAKFGILEPMPSCAVFDAKHLDLILTPGVGFSLAGGRLGRGKGFYDRLLAEVPGYKCGVAFDWQLAVEVPAEPHDVRLNCILTPLLWHEVPASART
jgi:5-formyltetrahydrofolate cyclo-ligase